MKRLAVLAPLVLVLAACGSEDSGSGLAQTADNPRDGWVALPSVPLANDTDIEIWKRCDGTTLVYVSDGAYAGGIATVPDSPECAP